MKAEITEQNEIKINDVVINEQIFQEERVDYILRGREEQIKDLYMWIGEKLSKNEENDLYAMKEDLHYLESIEDEFIFSSISTNEFIAQSDNAEDFNNICKEILELNDLNTNGYQALIGISNKAGTYKYFDDKQNAGMWAELQRKILAGHIKGNLKIFITPIKLHKCNMSYCNELIPIDEITCLGCLKLIDDAQADKLEILENG